LGSKMVDCWQPEPWSSHKPEWRWKLRALEDPQPASSRALHECKKSKAKGWHSPQPRAKHQVLHVRGEAKNWHGEDWCPNKKGPQHVTCWGKPLGPREQKWSTLHGVSLNKDSPWSQRAHQGSSEYQYGNLPTRENSLRPGSSPQRSQGMWHRVA
jgi:hypothetical protein